MANGSAYANGARLLAVLAALLFAFDTPAIAGEDRRDRSVIGKWKLVSLLDLASIASLDETEARTLLGKVLTISETAVQVDGELCSPPEFWAERITPEPHMQQKLHSSAERLRLPDPATMVELGCTDVYIRNARELVLLWGGAMFDAVRMTGERRQPPKMLPAPTQVPKTRPVPRQPSKMLPGPKPPSKTLPVQRQPSKTLPAPRQPAAKTKPGLMREWVPVRMLKPVTRKTAYAEHRKAAPVARPVTRVPARSRRSR